MRIENRFANIFVPKWRDLKTFSWNFNFNFAVTTSLPTTSISTSLLLYILRNCNHGGMVVVKPSPSSHISRWFFQQNSSPVSEVSKLSKWKRKAWIFTICIFLELNNFSIELYFNFIIFDISILHKVFSKQSYSFCYRFTFVLKQTKHKMFPDLTVQWLPIYEEPNFIIL